MWSQGRQAGDREPGPERPPAPGSCAVTGRPEVTGAGLAITHCRSARRDPGFDVIVSGHEPRTRSRAFSVNPLPRIARIVVVRAGRRDAGNLRNPVFSQ